MSRGRAWLGLAIGLAAAICLAGTTAVPAAEADVPSAAGPGVGSVVVFTPAVSITPTAVRAPAPVAPFRGGVLLPIATPIPSLSPAVPGVLILTPVRATGALAVPVQAPSASGSSLSFSTWQLVIPGPNPAQNTSVALSQLLDSLLAPPRPAGGVVVPVTVLTTPSR